MGEELSVNSGLNTQEIKKAIKVSKASFKKIAIFPALAIIMVALVKWNGTRSQTRRPFGKFLERAIDSEPYRYALIIIISLISILAVMLVKKAVFAGKYRSTAGKEKLAAFKYLQGYPEPLQALMATHNALGLICMLPVLFGFVVFWRSLNLYDFIICLTVTIGLYWYSYPRYDEWETFMRNSKHHIRAK